MHAQLGLGSSASSTACAHAGTYVVSHVAWNGREWLSHGHHKDCNPQLIVVQAVRVRPIGHERDDEAYQEQTDCWHNH